MLLLTAIFLAAIAHAQPGLVAHWSFDEPAGDTLYDNSSYANWGMNYGAERVPGIKGNALGFDGSDDYARIPRDGAFPPAVLAGLGQGSISVWFKADHIPTDYGIAPIFYYGGEEKCDFFDAANSGLIIELGHTPIHFGSERLYFTIWKNGCTYPSFCYDSRTPVSEGEWHHFVAVVGENYNTGYLDGVEMINRRYNFGNELYSQFFEDALLHENLWIGRGYWDRNDMYFDGKIDELRIYDRPLTANEVWQLYTDTTTTGIHDQGGMNQTFQVYPNPSDGPEISIAFTDKKKTVVGKLEIVNIAGEMVYSAKTSEQQTIIQISVKKWPSGVYVARALLVDGTSVNQKFVIN